MFMINTADYLNAILLLAATVLTIILSKETKSSISVLCMLVIFLCILILHAVQLGIVDPMETEIIKIISNSLTMDFALISVAFLGYLWADDIETKEKKKNSIDNSLEWFWKKV